MRFTEGLGNVQNIPGDTDFEDVTYNKEDKSNKKDKGQMPPDTIITPINDPLYEKNQQPINENSREPQRIMRNFTYSERRIF